MLPRRAGRLHRGRRAGGCGLAEGPSGADPLTAGGVAGLAWGHALASTPIANRGPRMTALERLIPSPDLVEVHAVDVAAAPERAWERVRHGDLGEAAPVRALFALRTLPDRLRGAGAGATVLRLDDLRSTPERPGFAILTDDPPREVAVGAIGAVRKRSIPFVQVADADAFAAFDAPGQVKVAWAVRVIPGEAGGATVVVEVRVRATDPSSARRFRRYFRIVGPGSRLIRRTVLARLVRDLGARERALPGDTLLADASEQTTHAVAVAAPPERIWPWLVQMGRGRGGFYSIDLVDNGGARSAREVHPEMAGIDVGDLVPIRPRSDSGFEVLAMDEGRSLVLGGLWDPGAGHQRPFGAPRPERFVHCTWSFALEALGGGSTLLLARTRMAVPPATRINPAWLRPAHNVMQATQLRNLAARAEERLPANDWRDVLVGIGGAGRMGAAMLTPGGRTRRARWGAGPEVVDRHHPGDDLVPEPRWGWTHAIEVAAPPWRVWPWAAQIGAGRAGFYSYSWLENLAGCALRDAERVHPEWELREGDALVLHPSAPPLRVVEVAPGHHLVASGPADEEARREGRPWVAASWLVLVEETAPGTTRVVSRYRCATSDDLRTRLAFGPALLEPIGSTMDRRMLLGIQGRAEHAPRAIARI